MEKIERYLDQACHGIAGPRALRAHIRQELREHLLDAIAEHKAAGMSDDEALTRALEDFGGPDLVRAELETAHGHRLMTVVLDKALQWKEKTMKARWLWSSWAYIALALTVIFEIVFLLGVVIFLLPKYRQIVKGGWVEDAPYPGGGVLWGIHFLNTLAVIFENWIWIIIPLVLLWSLFEWRVRSENKSMMRFSALGTVAAGLCIVSIFAAAAVSLPFLISLSPDSVPEGAPADVLHRMQAFDQSITDLDKAVASGNASAIMAQADQAVECSRDIHARGMDPAALAIAREQGNMVRFTNNYIEAYNALQELQSVAGTDETRVKAALRKVHAAYDPIRWYALPDATRPAEEK